MLEGAHKPKFVPIFNSLRSTDMEESGEHLHGEVTKGGLWRLYTRAPLMPNGSGEMALERGSERQKAARLVKQAMANQFGPDKAEDVFRKVQAEVHAKTGRHLDEEMTRGDLNLLQLEYKELQREELRKLRDRVPTDTPLAIKDDVVGNWTAATSKDWTYRNYQWPNGDTVNLNTHAYSYYVQGGSMRFDEAKGTLTLEGKPGDSEENKKALAKFIDKHFGAKPGQPEFQNIANNVLLYLPAIGRDLDLHRKVENILHVANYDPRVDIVQRTYTLSVRDGSVGVKGNTSIRYESENDVVASTYLKITGFDFSKYRFVREEGFEISCKNLKSQPDEFKPEANLVSVGRFDTIELAN